LRISVAPERSLTNPVNKALESGAWTQSIVWNSQAPFRDFTALELNEEDMPEERVPGTSFSTFWIFHVTMFCQPKQPDLASGYGQTLNLGTNLIFRTIISTRYLKTVHVIAFDKPLANWLLNTRILRKSCNYHLYVVSAAYMFVFIISASSQYKTRLTKQEARSFHRPALQFPSNIELHFSKVRSAKKKKDKAGRKIGKGGNVGEGLHRTSDLTLKDTSNSVLWEYSVPYFTSGLFESPRC
jgi:transcription initiation factor TFIID subunit 1, fungi type